MFQGLLYSPTVNSTELVLSAEEKQWLTDHPVIRLSPNPVFAPIEEVNSDGEYIGMAADYMALIEKKVNIEFTVVGYPSWKKVIEQARQKNVDVLATLARSSQREAYLSFTTAYMNLPGMIFVSDQTPGRVTMDDLKNMNVATPAGDAWRDLIGNNHPDIRLLEAENLTQGLLDLSSGLLDAVIADPATVTNVVREQGFSNLRIGGETGYYISFAFAVRKDWPMLIDILEKAIQSISEQEHQAIFDKWVEFKIETRLSNNVQIGLLIAGLVVIVLVIGFVFMRAMIRIRVAQQTGELDEANAKLFEINAELEQSLIEQTRELEKARTDLSTSQVNMVQSEKMAALGQMIAGIARLFS
jgi:ABC-type amino acid transport substrate-binding protein